MSSSSDPNPIPNPIDLSSLQVGPDWARESSLQKSDHRKKKKKGAKKTNRSNASSLSLRSRSPRKGPHLTQNHRSARSSSSVTLPLPSGITASIVPEEQGLDQMAKEMKATGRTYSVFAVAKCILKERDRYQVRFSCQPKEEEQKQADQKQTIGTEEQTPSSLPVLWQGNQEGPATDSIWCSEQEALQYALKSSKVLERLYEAETVQQDPPQGNFSAVARCGISGELIAPPNYHAYQVEVARRHRDQFSHLSKEQYLKEIKIDHEEESVQKWKDSMTQIVCYRSRPFSDSSSLEAQSDAPSDESPDNPLLNQDSLAQHLREHHFDSLFKSTSQALVKGTISKSCLSPELFALLLDKTRTEREYPKELAPLLCRQFSGRHLAVFKWKKKLMVGPSRPHAIPSDSSFSERIEQLISWVKKHSGAPIEQLWSDLLPQDCDDDLKKAYYHDLHWLLNQGYFLFFSEKNTVHLAKEAPPENANNVNNAKPINSVNSVNPKKFAKKEAPLNPNNPNNPT